MDQEKGAILCSECSKQACRNNYPEGIPTWCAATRFHDELEKTKTDYSAPGDLEIYLAAGKVTSAGSGKWPRIQEAIEFSRALNVSRIGLASCVSLISELALVSRLFKGAGFNVVTSACQIGRIAPGDRGVKVEDEHGLTCNPIAQAEICNQAGTQLNFILGLCMGHDLLFMKHSKAPVSVLIVKDRVTGNNPAAALYADFPRRALLKQYCGK